MKIIVLDGNEVPNPEDLAMLSAMYSRSPKTVTSHLEQVKKRGSASFMQQFYIGYGHSSIGDCGSTSIFFENISMLAAKAIQDWPLYRGQESSTRYMDFSQVEFMNPTGTPEGEAIQEAWRNFYLASLEPVQKHVARERPRWDGEDLKVYEKAVKARAFDILRGFLPAGAQTMVAWHTDLRQAADHLRLLRHHPLVEVSEIADATLDSLALRYPSSFGKSKDDEIHDYENEWCNRYAYFTPSSYFDPQITNTVDNIELFAHLDLFDGRPPKATLPYFVNEFGNVRFDFWLDFASFRDLQRHRPVVNRMPLLTMDYHFHLWYQMQLPEYLSNMALELLLRQKEAISALGLLPEDSQYYIPMGYQVPCRITGGLRSIVYLLELRSGKSVHPTLRKAIQNLVRLMEVELPVVKLHADMSSDDFNIRRGSQDIVAK